MNLIFVSTQSVSDFSISDSELKGMYEIELSITNPNKKVELMVDRFYVSVFYGSVELSRAIVLQPIHLNKNSDKDVKVTFSLRNPSTNYWNMGSREKFLDIYCGNLDVGFVAIKDTVTPRLDRKSTNMLVGQNENINGAHVGC
ncbi:uncharacterized protein [Cicer arietinum]|uniref:uncharacterized protein n=1 Tax=Cicer arietinum TaxID=3827 RepID=UPI003CC53349